MDMALRDEKNARARARENAPSSSPVFPSSFIAINAPNTAQALTRKSTLAVSSAPNSRQRNSAIAQYLGLGVGSDMPEAQMSAPPQLPSRKRQRVSKSANSEASGTPKKKKPRRAANPKQSTPKQTTISDDLPVTKQTQPLSDDPPVTKQTQLLSDDLAVTKQTQLLSDDLPVTMQTDPLTSDPSFLHRDPSITRSIMRHLSHQIGESDTATDTHLRDDRSETLEAYDSTQLATQFRDAEVPTQRLPNYQDAEVPTQRLPNYQDGDAGLGDSVLDEGIGDDELLSLAAHSENFEAQSSSQSAQLTPPVIITTPLSSEKLDIDPIVRPPFPTQVRDRSPIVGLTPNRLLRTCFRVGEALNAGRSAARNGKNVMIELYARVKSSTRDETKQHFVLCDLFHTRKPYIDADYDATIWRSVPLYEIDSRVFLAEDKADGEHKMCRCILTMKINSATRKLVVTMLNIWAATREDIQWVEGILNS